MFCNRCGSPIADGAKFCNNCGTPVAQPAPQYAPQPAPQQPYVAPVTGGETTVLTENARDWQYAQQNNSFVTEQPAQQTPPAAPVTGGETTVLTENARDWQYAQQNNTFVTGQQTQQNAYAPQQNAYAPQQNAYAPQQSFAQPQFDQPKQKKKGKKGLAVGIASVALVLVVAIILCFTLTPLKGVAVKTFGSSDDYMQYVEDKAIDSYTNDALSVYGKFLSTASDLGESYTKAGTAQLKLNVGSDAITMLEQLLKEKSGTEMDLDWLNSISLDMDANAKGTLYQMGAALNIDSQTIAQLDEIVDFENLELYLAVLNLSSKYIKIPMDSIGKQSSTVRPYGAAAASAPSVDMEELMEKIPEFVELLPSEKEMDKVLSKYLAIVTDNIEEVSKTTEKVSIGDISEKLTVLEIEIDTDTVYAISVQLLETLAKDKDVEKYINKIASYLEKEDYIDDADDIYDNFSDAVDSALDELEDLEDEKNEKLMTIIDYVNSKHEVVGREFKIAHGGPTLSYLTVHKGNNFATLIDIPDTCRIEGEGTDKGNIVNGTFTLKAAGMEICELEIADFDLDKLDEGYLNGTFRIAPSAAMLKRMGLESSGAAMLALANPALEIKVASDKKSGSLDMNILNGDKIFVGFTLTGNTAKGADITLPSGKDVVDVENAQEWAESVDFDKLITALKKTDIPEKLISMLEMSLKGDQR